MSNILKKIETAMTDGEKNSFFSFGSFLFMFSIAYGSAVKLRETFYKKGILHSKRLPCMVISIGNITVGGTGKTPMTIYVAELVRKLGYNVAIISRGYKGGAEITGGVVSNGRTIFLGPDTAGDEPFMMAKRLKSIPVVIGQNRFEAGMLAIRAFDPDVLVLDDAFQHLKLVRDIDLVLLDYSNPLGNTHLLPRGTLREPFSALLRGDAFVLTRSNTEKSRSLIKLKNVTEGRPVFKTFHIPYIYKVVKGKNVTSQNALQRSFTPDLEFLKGRNVFAFSGIARNNDFRRMLEDIDCNIAGFLEFPDHYLYSADDLHTILKSARDAKAGSLITTEKDYTRIAHRITWPMDLVVMGIRISFENNNAFNQFIKNRLAGVHSLESCSVYHR